VGSELQYGDYLARALVEKSHKVNMAQARCLAQLSLVRHERPDCTVEIQALEDQVARLRDRAELLAELAAALEGRSRAMVDAVFWPLTLRLDRGYGRTLSGAVARGEIASEAELSQLEARAARP